MSDAELYSPFRHIVWAGSERDDSGEFPALIVPGDDEPDEPATVTVQALSAFQTRRVTQAEKARERAASYREKAAKQDRKAAAADAEAALIAADIARLHTEPA